MSDIEIIQAAYNKAVQQGYKGKLPTIETKDGKHYLCTSELIFEHDFARSLWGDGYTLTDKDGLVGEELSWEEHLQQMVLEEDPLKYLEANL